MTQGSTASPLPGVVAAARERLSADFRSNWPLRMELESIERILAGLDTGPMTCLDLGFTNPVASLRLRRQGGYWSTVVASRAQVGEATSLLDEDVLQAGAGGELPFEDKQFDVVVVARGRLSGEPGRDEAMVQECHRVLKTPGYLIVSGDFRKRINLAGLFGRAANGTAGAGYDERQLFDLLKTGFDVLGVKTYCRFWMQLTRLLFDPHDRGHSRMMAVLYWIAYQLDVLLFFTKGYQLIAYGRRKGWRPRQPIGSCQGRTIGEAVLRRSRI